MLDPLLKAPDQASAPSSSSLAGGGPQGWSIFYVNLVNGKVVRIDGFFRDGTGAKEKRRKGEMEKRRKGEKEHEPTSRSWYLTRPIESFCATAMYESMS
jgi:hypothetical protein